MVFHRLSKAFYTQYKNCEEILAKSIVITDTNKYIDPSPVTIRQHEFNVLKQKEFLIKKQFSSYVKLYKKEVQRRQKNHSLPVSLLCRYSTLKYFHEELKL